MYPLDCSPVVIPTEMNGFISVDAGIWSGKRLSQVDQSDPSASLGMTSHSTAFAAPAYSTPIMSRST